MTCHYTVRRLLAQFAITLLCFATLPVGLAKAGLVSTEAVLAETYGSAEHAHVQAFLEREDVRQQLAALGVDPAEASSRVLALSDAEIAQIAGQLEQLPAGEGVLTTVAVLAGLILFFMILNLLPSPSPDRG
jgi:hypothetical protein